MGRKLKVLLVVFTLAILSCQMVSAASVTFTNFAYTTEPYTDVPVEVARKTKEDDEQNWYVTLTDSSNLSHSSTGVPIVLVLSNTRVSTLETVSAPIPLYSDSGASGAIPYKNGVIVKAGTTCKLVL